MYGTAYIYTKHTHVCVFPPTNEPKVHGIGKIIKVQFENLHRVCNYLFSNLACPLLLPVNNNNNNNNNSIQFIYVQNVTAQRP
jgi:hypothetical protein